MVFPLRLYTPSITPLILVDDDDINKTTVLATARNHTCAPLTTTQLHSFGMNTSVFLNMYIR
jgi:hypothetical protein